MLPEDLLKSHFERAKSRAAQQGTCNTFGIAHVYGVPNAEVERKFRIIIINSLLDARPGNKQIRAHNGKIVGQANMNSHMQRSGG